jgi:predicted ester cyclase
VIRNGLWRRIYAGAPVAGAAGEGSGSLPALAAEPTSPLVSIKEAKVSEQDNKAIIRRGFEAMNSKDLSVFEEIMAPGYVNHDMPAPAPGPQGFKEIVGAFIAAFPDMHITLEAQLGDGDLVANRGVFTGTQQGEFMGIPPTGKQVTMKFMDMWRLEDGKAVENWVRLDMMGLMEQLGVMPPPPGGQA